MGGLTLYDITGRFMEIMNQEELTQEEFDAFKAELGEMLQTKSTGIIGYVRNTETTIAAIKSEEERLYAMRKAFENRLDKFKKYVKDNMETMGLESVDTQIGKLSIAKSPASVTITSEDEIPAEFKIIKQEIVVDKKRILEHFKDTGEVLDGTQINTSNTYLKIK